MTDIRVLAIDLAKGSFQVCAVGPDGVVLSNRAMSRTRLAALLASQPACLVTMEACATSHHWGLVALSHAPTSASNLRIHPGMADTYHTRIRAPIERLSEPASDSDARDEIRSLIERIVVTPVPTGGKRKKPELHLYGDLAGILSMSLGMTEASMDKKTTDDQEVAESMVLLLARRRSRRGKLPGQATRLRSARVVMMRGW